MKSFSTTLAAIASLVITLSTPAAEPAAEQPTDTQCYELRVYYAAEGKLDALHARFRDHTVKLFAKHGMKNIGYWVPLENPERKLIYLLAFPGRKERDESFQNFLADPEWQKAAKESEADGKLVEKMESTFLTAADISPEIKCQADSPERTFELRTYTTPEGKLDALQARFRDHTIALFSKHGMSHFGYWNVSEGPAKDVTLLYLLAHKDAESCAASFKAFREDPIWIAAKAASEKAAGGSLTVEDGVKSILLAPTDYSPTK